MFLVKNYGANVSRRKVYTKMFLIRSMYQNIVLDCIDSDIVILFVQILIILALIILKQLFMSDLWLGVIDIKRVKQKINACSMAS